MPTWDQTLVFENIELFEDPQKLSENPPCVVIDIFDKDTIVRAVLSFCVTYLVEAVVC